jgi:hypothetical protein
MLADAAIGVAVVLAGVYFVLPYHQAHKRRKELARKHEGRRSNFVKDDVR